MRSSLRTTLAALALSALACDTTFPWTDAAAPRDPPGPTFELSPTSLQFTAVSDGATPAPQQLAVAARGGPLYLAVSFSGPAIASAVLDPASGTISVSVPAPGGAGTFTGTVMVRGYLDPGGTQEVAGSPRTLGVTYLVAPSSAPAISVAAGTSLSFTATAGRSAPSPRTFDVAIANGPVALQVAASGGATATVVSQTATAATVEVAPPAPGATPGTTSGSVQVVGCTEASCAQQVAGSPLSVPYTYTVVPSQLAVEPTSLAFSAVRTQTPLPPAQTLALTTEHGGALTYTREVIYGAGATGWLSVPASGTAPGSLDVAITTAALAPGRYTASVRLDPSNLASPTWIAVTYDVAAPSLEATPAALAFAVDPTTTAAGLSEALALDAGGAPVAWTATPSQPWVSVSPASGTTPAVPVVSLVPAQLEALPPGAHAASIALRYEAAPGETATVDVPVDLALDLPLLEAVSPRAAVAGVGGEVIVRGAGLPVPFAGTVRLGGTAAASAAGVSATELRVTPPALAAGSHRVALDNALGLARSRARLEVVAPATRGAAAVASPGAKARIVFDDAAGVLYVANVGTGALERHREAASWAKAPDGSDELALAGLKDIALSPRGETILAVAGTSFRLVDAAALALSPVQPTAAAPSTSLVQLEMTNAGKAVFIGQGGGWSTVSTFDLATHAVTKVPYPAGEVWGATLAAGAGGARVVAAERGITSPSAVVWHASTGTTTRTTLGHDAWFGALDRLAERLILFGAYDAAKARRVSRLYDRDLEPLAGTVPPATQAVLLSPLGRARAFTWNGTVVSCFDLEGPLDADGFHPLLAWESPVASPGASARLALSADERTAFLAGDAAVVIVPLVCP